MDPDFTQVYHATHKQRQAKSEAFGMSISKFHIYFSASARCCSHRSVLSSRLAASNKFSTTAHSATNFCSETTERVPWSSNFRCFQIRACSPATGSVSLSTVANRGPFQAAKGLISWPEFLTDVEMWEYPSITSTQGVRLSSGYWTT